MTVIYALIYLLSFGKIDLWEVHREHQIELKHRRIRQRLKDRCREKTEAVYGNEPE